MWSDNRKSILLVGAVLFSVALLISGCSRRGGDGSDDNESRVWGLRITSIESMTGMTYVECNVHADNLGTNDGAVVYVVNRYPDYWSTSDDDIDPSYNVVILRSKVTLTIPGYTPFSFSENIYLEVQASTSDTSTSVNVVVLPATLKSQIATIVDAEGGMVEGTVEIRLEGDYGNGEEAYATGKTQARITSSSA